MVVNATIVSHIDFRDNFVLSLPQSADSAKIGTAAQVNQLAYQLNGLKVDDKPSDTP